MAISWSGDAGWLMDAVLVDAFRVRGPVEDEEAARLRVVGAETEREVGFEPVFFFGGMSEA